MEQQDATADDALASADAEEADAEEEDAPMEPDAAAAVLEDIVACLATFHHPLKKTWYCARRHSGGWGKSFATLAEVREWVLAEGKQDWRRVFVAK